MNFAILILLTSLCNALCIGIGVAVGAMVIRKPEKSAEGWKEKPLPVSRRERKEQAREEKQKQAALDTMMHNIDVYDGTGAGQRDVNY